ncbi:MAG: hypothetical protein BRD39_01255 [Bacteroidetes bacterium QH_9_64_21]|nr:MAG: hypothetical protein BRD39_01255 [Bacteroidetes bacterium QH_9_64_21]
MFITQFVPVMNKTTRNRLIGAIIVLAGLTGLGVLHQFSGIIGTTLSLLAGACLGMGSALLVTAKPLWNPDTWWAAKSPLKRDWF